MKKFNKTLLALALGLTAANVSAAGFQLNETSISGLGRAFAGDAVIADDASVLARNPAAMALFDKAAVSIGATYVDPGVDVKGTGAPDLVGGDSFDMSRLDQEGAVPPAVIPIAFFINPINEQFAYGIGVNVNYGLASEYDADYAAGSIGGETDLTSINLNLSGSYRLDEQWSFGAGLNLVYAEATLQRRTGAVLENGVGDPRTPLDQSDYLVAPISADTKFLDLEGDDITWGWNVGVVYEINDNHRFGLTYRSEVNIEFDGHIQVLGTAKSDGYVKLDLPAMAEFSGFHQFTEQWAFHYSALYTEWSSFEKLEGYSDDIEEPLFTKPENFDDSVRYAVGLTYTLSEKVTLRTGIALDESASVEDYRSISIPDSDRLWFSAGITYNLTPDSSIDFGVSYIDGDKVDVHEKDALLEGVLEKLPEELASLVGNEEWSFESEGNAILLGLQYNRSF